MPMKAPHSQFNGRRYCPYEKDALPYNEWKKVKRKEMSILEMNIVESFNAS